MLFVDASGSKFATAENALSLDESSAKAFISRALASSANDVADFASVPLFPSPEVAKKKPKVALQALTPRDVRQCLSPSRKQMCVIVATRDEAEADAVRALAKKYRRDPFAFFTTSSADSVFQAVTGFVGEPASDDVRVVVLKAGRKNKYSGTVHCSTVVYACCLDSGAMLMLCFGCTNVRWTVLPRSGDADTSVDEFLDKLLDGSSGFTVATGDQQVLEAALDARARSETRSAHSDEL